MYLKRKIDDVLERWFANPKRLPLLLKGARQIGKTAAVRHFASAHYEQTIEVNFIEQPKFKHITDWTRRASSRSSTASPMCRLYIYAPSCCR